jgi:hypothetical protein
MRNVRNPFYQLAKSIESIQKQTATVEIEFVLPHHE